MNFLKRERFSFRKTCAYPKRKEEKLMHNNIKRKINISYYQRDKWGQITSLFHFDMQFFFFNRLLCCPRVEKNFTDAGLDSFMNKSIVCYYP